MRTAIFHLLFLLATGGYAQDIYSVVKVVGKVENDRLGRAVKTGDKIESKDGLRFISPKSHLIIISPKTGRKVIQGVPDNAPREIFQLLESFVRPEERSTATRSTLMAYIEELGSTLHYDTLLILGEGQITVNNKSLSLKPPAVIKMYYHAGTKTIFRKISDDHAFYLNRASLFGSDFTAPYPKIAIEYYKNGSEDPVMDPGSPIASFVPVFIDDADLKSEVDVIAFMLGNVPPKTLSKEIKNYLVSEYRGVQDQNLDDWLKSNKFIKE